MEEQVERATINDADFGLRVAARAKIRAGDLPTRGALDGVQQGVFGPFEPCKLCERTIDADESWVRLQSGNSMHELCFLAWCSEVEDD